MPRLAQAQGETSDAMSDLINNRTESIQRPKDSISTAAPVEPRRTNEFMAIQTTTGISKNPKFEFLSIMPLTWTDNPLASNKGSASSLHGTPTIKLSGLYDAQDIPVQISGFFGLVTDRYTTGNISNSADADRINARIQLAYASEEAQVIVPFIRYNPTVMFNPTFGNSKVTFHDISVGLIPNIPKTTISFSFSLDGGYREAVGTGAVSSYFVRAVPGIDYSLNDQWKLSLQTSIIQRWFDGVSRDDTLIQPILTLFYNPDTTMLAAAPQIGLQFAFANLRSSNTAAEFQQWDIGPSLSLKWKL
jgi:hypothetical protein